MDLKSAIAQRREEAASGTKSQSAAVSERMQQDQRDPDAVILLVDQIETREQGRRTFENLEELAELIRKEGLLQSIVVREIAPFRYRLVAGERRLRAVRDILKLDTIAAKIRRNDADELEDRVTQISENTGRDDYIAWELSIELNDLKQKTGWTSEEIGKRIGKSKSFVSKILSLTTSTPEPIQEKIKQGHIAATDWFNNKDFYLNELDQGRLDETRDKELLQQQDSNANDAQKPEASTPPKPAAVRKATVAIPMESAVALTEILKILAEKQQLPEIDFDPKGKITKKQLQTILTVRSADVLKSL